MPAWAIILIVFGGLIVFLGIIFAIWWISTYNGLIKLRNNAEEGYSTMDVSMKKRYDLIPNLVETVKGFAKHEKETLEGVMEARYACMSANDPEDKAKKENMLTGTLKTLFNVAENYPQLKADANFAALQNTLRELESEIASSRKYYNGCVKMLNNKIEMFPSNLVANHYHFEKKVLFEIADDVERQAPQVKF